jgi:hypothetical protein
MANTKLQFTYLWADEDVMQQDFAGRFSQKMTDWTVQFFRQYEFDVDVDPAPSAKPRTSSLSKYAIQKNDGVMPDRRPLSQRVQDFEARQARIEEERSRLDAAHEQAVAANNPAEAKRLQGLIDEVDRKLRTFWDDMFDVDENKLRGLLTWKSIRDGVLPPDRFLIIFCRFRYTTLMQMRRPRGKVVTMGEVFPKKPQDLVRLYGMSVVLPLWSDRFAIIDPFEGARKEIVHECVHAAGHDHPTGPYLKAVEKTYRGRRLPGKGFERPRDRSLAPDYDDPVWDVDEVPQYDTFQGGIDDGEPDDVMNYAIDDPDVGRVHLRPAHVDLLKRAYFAK